MSQRVNEIVTERIIRYIEEHQTLPWVRPVGVPAFPKNVISRKEYRGSNLIALWTAPYMSPWWMTARQAKELGGSVRKGEHGFVVTYWITDTPETAPSETDKHHPILRYYLVFNAEQCEGIPADRIPDNTFHAEHNPIAAAEAIWENMPDPPVLEVRGKRCCYLPKVDTIRMPALGHFPDPAEYYASLFHEAVHATAHPSRLGRDLSCVFADDRYSKEELVAELGAAMLCARCGIADTTIPNHAAYLKGWLDRLKAEPRWLVSAGSAAQKAADWIAPMHAAGFEESRIQPRKRRRTFAA